MMGVKISTITLLIRVSSAYPLIFRPVVSATSAGASVDGVCGDDE